MYSLIKFDAQSRNPKDSRLPSHYLDITDCLYTRTYATMQLVDLRNHGKTKMYFLVKRSVKNFSIVWLIKYYYLQPFLKESKTKMRHQMSCVVKKKKQTNKMNFWALHVLSQRQRSFFAILGILQSFSPSRLKQWMSLFSLQGCSYIVVCSSWACEQAALTFPLAWGSRVTSPNEQFARRLTLSTKTLSKL